jgi:hypothetical protein
MSQLFRVRVRVRVSIIGEELYDWWICAFLDRVVVLC